jgi:hypothetical protein
VEPELVPPAPPALLASLVLLTLPVLPAPLALTLPLLVVAASFTMQGVAAAPAEVAAPQDVQEVQAAETGVASAANAASVASARKAKAKTKNSFFICNRLLWIRRKRRKTIRYSTVMLCCGWTLKRVGFDKLFAVVKAKSLGS